MIIENAWETLMGWRDIEAILEKKPEVSARIVDQKEGSRRQKGYSSTVNEAIVFQKGYREGDQKLKFAYDYPEIIYDLKNTSPKS